MTADATVADRRSDEANSDPLKCVADALKNAADKIGDDAATRETCAMPASRCIVSRFIYATSYYTSYGVVFPALFVAHAIPGLSSIGNGLSEGAASARDAVLELKARRTAKKAADAAAGEIAADGTETLAGAKLRPS
jgi:hypothetical protein